MAQRKVVVKTLEAYCFEVFECKNNLQVQKFGRENDVIWNDKYSNSIHVAPNHTNLNEPIPSDSANIGPIHNSSDICAIEKILTSSLHLVHKPSLVTAPPILFMGQ